jgi:hypothetical protein
MCGDAASDLATEATADGAVAVGTRRSRGDLLKSTLVGGGVLVGGVYLGLPQLAASASPKARDIQVLNFLLLLEYAQAAFYDDALAGGKLGADLREFARTAQRHEQEHVEALRERLGKRARKSPKFDFSDEVVDGDVFKRTAFSLEESACGSYIGQAGNLSRGLRPLAAGIVSIDARHAAWIRDILGRNPAPFAADRTKEPEVVLRFLKRRFLTS